MNAVSEISIGPRFVGSGHPCLVIAEVGVNHNGDLARARKLVIEARRAGADCVKFQTFSTERVASRGAPKAAYQLRTTDPGEGQSEMLRKLEMPASWHAELMSLCRQEGILFLSTPYSVEDVDLLDDLGVHAFKLASIHCAEPNFVAYVARKHKPIVLSTGMATLEEVSAAVAAARGAGNGALILLQCTTEYPARVADANLRTIPAMREAFAVPVGYSDHTESTTACIAAVALGACVVEKHFTLDRALPGPDHAASFDPAQFAALVGAIRDSETALGDGIKRPCAVERENIKTMRRSLAARRDLEAGEFLTEDAVTMLRPGTGIKPARLQELLGRRLARSVPSGQLLSIDDFGSAR